MTGKKVDLFSTFKATEASEPLNARTAEYFEKRGVPLEYIERDARVFVERRNDNRFGIPFFLPDGELLTVERSDGQRTPYRLMREWNPPRSDPRRKFVGFKDVHTPLYFPPIPRKFKRSVAKLVEDTKSPMIVTEGPVKGMSIAAHGGFNVAVSGCWNWQSKGSPVPEWELVKLKGREVTITYDADVAENVDVQDGLIGLRDFLLSRDARVFICLLPPVGGDPKAGADDYIAAHGYKSFEQYIKQNKKPADDPSFEQWGSAAQLEHMNRQHAVVMVHSQALILTEHPADLKLSTQRDLELLYANRFMGEAPLLRWWIEHPDRRTHTEIVFAPTGKAKAGAYNLWRGFAVESVRGKCDKFLDHVRKNIAQGDALIYEYLINWMADAVQNPTKRPGVSIALRGEQGVGKGAFAKHFGSLFGDAHFYHARSSRELVGRFNAHLANKLIVFGDEAVWAGDKGPEGILKGLITEETLQVEKKGKDIFTLPNYLRFIIATNSDWVVPAGPWERRFCVIDVGDARMQDEQYFGALAEQMSSGGREALLYHLQHHDLKRANLRAFPRTAALWDQQRESMPDVHKFWFERLKDGALLPLDSEWSREVPKMKLHASFVEFAKDAGYKRRAAETDFGRLIKKVCPKVTYGKWRRDRDTGKRSQIRVYKFPSLDECRSAFAEAMGHEINWQEI